MNSYILTEKTTCPDEVSLIVKSYNYDCALGKLEIEFQNKGLFNISAFKIIGSTDSSKEKASIALPPSDNSKTQYHIFQKPLSPDGKSQSRTISYDKTKYEYSDLAFVEISPYVFEKGKSYICTNAIVKQKLECSSAI